MSVNKVNNDGSLKRIAGGTLYADAPLGTILAFGGTAAPAGWMLCQGQALSRTTYAKLFAIIGTAFGAGDGSTTFNIPDLRGEFLRGAGTNSHSGQGNGGSLGAHQDSTAIQNQIAEQNTHRLVIGFGAGNINMIKNSEGSTKEGLTGNAYMTNNQEITSVYTPFVGVRPTNTSVNYIIKVMMVSLPTDLNSAVDAKIAAKGVYSTSEVDTGKTWIDGKKIYRRVLNNAMTITGNTWTALFNISDIPADAVIDVKAFNNDKNVMTGFLTTYNSSNGNWSIYPQMANSISWSISKWVIEYTKATD